LANARKGPQVMVNWSTPRKKVNIKGRGGKRKGFNNVQQAEMHLHEKAGSLPKQWRSRITGRGKRQDPQGNVPPTVSD